MIDPNFIIGVLVGLFAGILGTVITGANYWQLKIRDLESSIDYQERIIKVFEELFSNIKDNVYQNDCKKFGLPDVSFVPPIPNVKPPKRPKKPE
jgi:hypothetical protein